MAVRLGRTPFVGREREQRTLLALLDEARPGRSLAVLVGGEPGVGKSSLLRQVAGRAREAGWLVAAGRAYEPEGMPPFVPFAEALRGLLGGDTAESDSWPAATGQAAAAPEIDRYRMFEAVVRRLFDTATAQPSGLFLWLDDLHWADAPTLLLLLHLLRQLNDATVPLVVAGAYRSGEADQTLAFRDLLAETARERLATRLLLGPLSLEETAHIVEAVAEVRPDDPLVAALHHRSGGNAFYLTELVLDLCEDGLDLAAAHAFSEQRHLPQSIRQVIEKRLTRLAPQTLRLLQAGAICGDGFGSSLVGAICGLAQQPLADAIDEALADGMLHEERNRYLFTHALIAQTLHEGMNAARRGLLHYAALEALESSARAAGAAPAELAHHALNADLDPADERPLRYALRAAERAMASLAFEEAVPLYTLALAALDRRGVPASDAERLAPTLARGEAERCAGAHEAAMRSFEAAFRIARSAGEPAMMARAAIRFEDALLVSGAPRAPGDASLTMQETALAALGTSEPALRTRLLAGLSRAHFFIGEQAEALRFSAMALDEGRGSDDPAALAAALNARRIAAWGPDNLPGRLALAGELRTLAAQTGDRELELEGRQWQLFALLEGGDTAGFDRELPRYAAAAEELGQAPPRFKAALWQAVRAGLDGRFAELDRFLARSLAEAERRGSEIMRIDATIALLTLRSAQERAGELVDAFAALAERNPALIIWWYILAFVQAEAGHLGEASTLFERLAAAGFIDVPRDYFWLMIHVFAARICVRLGDERRAALLYERLQPYHDSVAVVLPAYLGAVAQDLGALAALLRRHETAQIHFEAAVALNREAGALPQLVTSLRDYARILLARPKRRHSSHSRARALLEEAATLAAGFDGGAPPQIDALLRELGAAEGVRPRPAYPDGLTEREVEVLIRLAEGATNRRIAGELVLSERTVERHVEKAYAKIGAHSRSEATRYVLRHALR